MEDTLTRTLLITNFPRGTPHDELIDACLSIGPIRETFVLHNKYSVLFVGFYDVRDSEKAYSKLRKMEVSGSKLSVRYAIGRAEVPKGRDVCDKFKEQGTIAIKKGSEDEIMNTIKQEETESVTNTETEIIAKFYDIRAVQRVVDRLNTEVRYLWDNDLRRRRNMYSEAEETVKTAVHGYFKGSTSSSSSFPPTSSAFSSASPMHDDKKDKRRPKESNFFISLFDRFIRDNIDEIHP